MPSCVRVCGYHVGYDLLLLSWPFVGLVLQIGASGRDTPPGRWVALGLFGLLAGNYLATTSVMEGLQPHPTIALTVSWLNGTALLALFGSHLYEVVNPVLRIVSRDEAGVYIAGRGLS